MLLLVGFAIVQAVELRRITRERDRADRITQFMTGMFKVPDPSEARGNTVTAREILDKASKEIDTSLQQRPGAAGQNDVHHGGTLIGIWASIPARSRCSSGRWRFSGGFSDPGTRIPWLLCKI